MPFRFWVEVEREVSIEAYAQWVVGPLERHLSEKEVRKLNAVFGDEKKKAAFDALRARVNGKKGEDLVRAVQARRPTTFSRIVKHRWPPTPR